MKDIFIDSNIASRFCNPVDKEYIKLIQWLLKYDEEKDKKEESAHLVWSNKIVKEYYAANRGNYRGTNIVMVIDRLTKQGRLNKFSNQQIKDFHKKHFTKKVIKNLRSNRKDWDHIPAVLLSNRQYALAIDENFGFDLMNFPGHKATVASKPQDIPYDK